MKVKDLVGNVWTGKELKLRNMFAPKDVASVLNSKVSAQTVIVKNNSTNEIIGKRTIYQK